MNKRGRPRKPEDEKSRGTSLKLDPLLRGRVHEIWKGYPGSAWSWAVRQLAWLGVEQAESGRSLNFVPLGTVPTTTVRQAVRFTDLEEIQKEDRDMARRIVDLVEASRGRLELRKTKSPQNEQAPLLGEVAAGRNGLTLFATGEREDIEVPKYYMDRGVEYALRVRGDSMRDAGLHDRTVIYVRRVRRGEKVRSGKMVVALLNGEAYVKYLDQAEDGTPVLRSANSEFPPIRIKPDDQLLLQGVVVGESRQIEDDEPRPTRPRKGNA